MNSRLVWPLRPATLPPIRATALAAALLLGSSAHAYSLQLQPVSQTVGLGGQASVVVQALDLLPDGLGAYHFDLAYDPGILSFNQALDGLGLGIAFGLGATPGIGSVTFSDFSLESVADLLAHQGSAVDLFTVVFDAVGPGTSAVDFVGVTLADAAGNDIGFTTLGGSITVTRVPAPAPAALLLAAALAAGLMKRRRTRHQGRRAAPDPGSP